MSTRKNQTDKNKSTLVEKNIISQYGRTKSLKITEAKTMEKLKSIKFCPICGSSNITFKNYNIQIGFVDIDCKIDGETSIIVPDGKNFNLKGAKNGANDCNV